MTAPKLLCAFILATALPVCAHAGSGSYAVPPSPYGQVGNPFLAPVPVPHFPIPAPQAPVAPVPQPVVQTPVAVIQTPKSAPVRVTAPKPAPIPAPQTVATVTPPPAANDGYQVPATSKYAARINAARTNAARAATGQAATATAASAQPAVATAPQAPATDHVFVPGEHYTDASEAPRQYSLHRQWGLTPDKIITDHTATGALLTLSDVPGSGTTDKDIPTEDDDGAEAPSPAKTATP